MSVIVEDGSIVTNANSYVTRAAYIAYAASIGITIADSVGADEQLIQAAEYIDNFELNLKGQKVERDQALAFPRLGLIIDGWQYTSEEIPTTVIATQLAYALDINSGEDLYNRSANPTQIVTKERVEGAVEVNYASTGGALPATKVSKGDKLLARLLKSNSGTIGLVRT